MNRWSRYLIVVFWVVSIGLSEAGIRWFNTNTNRITLASGGTNYLTGSRLDSTIGYYLQLIYAGTNLQIDLAINGGDGVTVDDVVTAKLWMGKDVLGGDVNGWVNNGTAVAGIAGGLYYVRAWSAPAEDYANGLVPLSSLERYGNSPLWQYPGTPVPPGQDDPFNFGYAGWATTLQVPEPGLFNLCFMGLLMGRFLRRKSWPWLMTYFAESRPAAPALPRPAPVALVTGKQHKPHHPARVRVRKFRMDDKNCCPDYLDVFWK